MVDSPGKCNSSARILHLPPSKAELNQSQIAHALGVHKSTSSRELQRNHGKRGYRPKQVHQTALGRKQKHVTCRITSDTWATVEAFIEEDWSPAEVSGWLYENRRISISHESIYQYILKNKQQGGTLYRKRYGSKDRRVHIKNWVSIDERPTIVDKRKRIGDWEVDTIFRGIKNISFFQLYSRLCPTL